MPAVYEHKCSECDLTFPVGSGVYQYVLNNKGLKVPCPHPGESRAIDKALGLHGFNVRNAMFVIKALCFSTLGMKDRLLALQYRHRTAEQHYVMSRIGYNSNCLCCSCFEHVDLDLGESEYTDLTRKGRDQRLCPKCESPNVKTVRELKGFLCPKCKRGEITAEFIGIS